MRGLRKRDSIEIIFKYIEKYFIFIKLILIF